MYNLLFSKRFKDKFEKLSPELQKQIKKAIRTKLSLRPYDFKPLSGKKFFGLWRIRVGDYRIIYRIVDNSVYILAVGHRSKIYNFFSE